MRTFLRPGNFLSNLLTPYFPTSTFNLNLADEFLLYEILERCIRKLEGAMQVQAFRICRFHTSAIRKRGRPKFYGPVLCLLYNVLTSICSVRIRLIY